MVTPTQSSATSKPNSPTDHRGIGVQGLYHSMAVITVTPALVKLLDFETTLPAAVEELLDQKAGG